MMNPNSNSARAPQSCRLGLLLAVAAGTCASLAGPAAAATLNWNLLGVGSAGTAANWNPVQIPVAADTLVFDLTGSYTVNFPANVLASSLFTVREGFMTTSATGTHVVSGNINVGTIVGVAPRLTLTDGGFVSNGNIVIGTVANTSGEIRVQNGATSLATDSSGDSILVGNVGTGVLSILTGGLVDSAGATFVGNNPGANGTLNVNAFDNAPARSSTFNFTGNLFIGAGGTGTLNVLAGGQAVGTGTINVGFVSTGAGNINVGGTGLVDSALITSSSLNIGNNVSSVAGIGTVTVNSLGNIDIGGTTTIGDPNGGTGSLIVNGTGRFLTRALTIIPGNGTMTLNDGTTEVSGGIFNNGGVAFTIPGGSGQPFFILSGGADATFATANNSIAALTVGTSSNAVYRVSEPNSTTTITTGGVALGSSASGFGSLIVDASASFSAPAAATVNVGLDGRGIWLHGAGATSSTGDMNIAANPGSLGDVNINNNSTLNVTGEVAVGGTGTTPGIAGGDGELLIDGNNAIVNVTSNAAPAVRVFSTGTLTIADSGQLRVIGTGSTVVQGTLSLNGSIITNGFTLSSATPASLAGSITSTASVTINPGSTANLTGALSIAPTSNFFCSGTVNLGNNTLDVTNGFTSINGTLSIGPTGLFRPTNPVTLNAGGLMTGDGIFRGAVTNAGTITATGSGLTIEGGTINGLGQGMSGTEFAFNGGAFQGTGTINADVAGDTNGIITLLGGPLTIGRTTSANGIRFNGSAFLNSNVLILRDADALSLPKLLDFGSAGRVDINNGGNAVLVPPAAEIIGSGLIQYAPVVGVRAVTNAGTVRPGSGTSVGTVRVSCTSFRQEGDLRIDMLNPTDIDTLAISGGTVTLAPGSRVFFNLGFVPNAPFRRTFLTATSRLGLFSIATFAPVPLGRMRIDYTPTGADLVYCPADYNGDLTVDFFDYLDFVADFDSEAPFADFNHDGTVDFFDYLDFVAQFDAGCD